MYGEFTNVYHENMQYFVSICHISTYFAVACRIKGIEFYRAIGD
jgi:hypothetical protein